MPARPNYFAASQDTLEAMRDLQQKVSNSGLESRLLHLVYLVVSRINGCAYCIDMHSKDLRAEGETELRIDLVSVWEETDLYTKRKQAPFAWAESVPRVTKRMSRTKFLCALVSTSRQKNWSSLPWPLSLSTRGIVSASRSAAN